MQAVDALEQSGRRGLDGIRRAAAGLGLGEATEQDMQATELAMQPDCRAPDRADEVRLAWTQAPPEAKADVRALVGELDADVAFSVTTGNLEDYRDRPEYQLWRLYSGGDPGANWFLAGVRASPDPCRFGRCR